MDNATQYCCNNIGGGQHYYESSSGKCVSLGGLAFKRVWKEAMENCCNLYPDQDPDGFHAGYGTLACNDYCT
jgi:hypothetical protein